jgi:hypothetical protein
VLFVVQYCVVCAIGIFVVFHICVVCNFCVVCSISVVDWIRFVVRCAEYDRLFIERVSLQTHTVIVA